MDKTNSQHTQIQPQYAPFRLSVRADVTRLHGRYNFGLLILSFLFNRTFRPIFTLRLCQAASRFPTFLGIFFLLPCVVLHHWAQYRAGLDMSWKTEIGPGFKIDHGWGFVTGPGVIIGNNVSVYHGVTIGQKHKITPNGRIRTFPNIQDEVWIGPHALIAGDVVIGRGSRIAPGTIVTGDVDPYTTVGGNPMRVLKTNSTPDVVNPAKLS